MNEYDVNAENVATSNALQANEYEARVAEATTAELLADAQNQVALLQAELKEANERCERYSKSVREMRIAKARREEAVKEWIVNALAEDMIDRDAAKDLAEALDMELTRTVYVRGTWNATMEVSMFASDDEIGDNIEVTVEVSGEMTVEDTDFDIEDVQDR